MSVLIVYESFEGQTRKIAEFAEKQARAAGLEVATFDTSDKLGSPDFEGVDKVILAAPVHERRHPQGFEVFVSASRDDLKARKTLMLSVSLNAAFPDAIGESREYLTEMEMRTDFTADDSALVAGAVRPGSYDWFSRQVVRSNVLLPHGLDVSDDNQEFTDWDALEQTLSAFLNGGAE